MNRMHKKLIVFLLAALICIGCSERSAKQKEATQAALQALGKLKAATEVGVNYQQYGTLLIEAKAKVNEAAELLPDGDLKTNLKNSIQGYADASTYWTEMLDESIPLESPAGQMLLKKYKVGEQHLRWEDKKTILTLIWNSAEAFKQKASSIIAK